MIAEDTLYAVAQLVRTLTSQLITFGVVTQTSPLQIRFNADDAATAVDLVAAGYTPVLDDEVLLVRAGRDWIVVDAYETAP